MKRWSLIASFLLFIALCMSAAYWAMQFFKPPVRAVAAPPQTLQPLPKLDAAASLLGGRTAVAVASNFQLKGVVVGGNPADSVAILVANDKPAKAVRVNAEVIPGVTVKEVQRGYVLLSEGGIVKRVELPEKAKGGGSIIPPSAPGKPRRARPSPGTSEEE
jgi:general secretion pathway protein C